MTVAALGLQIDSGPLQAFAAAADKATTSASKLDTATGGAERSAAGYGKAIAAILTEVQKTNAALAQAQSTTEGAAKSIDLIARSSAQSAAALDKLHAALVKANSETGNAPKANDNHKASLDRLRAAFSPLEAAMQSHRATLAAISAEEQRGAISAMEAARYRSEAAQRMDAANRQISAREGGEGFSARVGFRPDQSLNLLRQGGDVGTMALMGASFTSIVASQGFQVAELFADTEKGARASLKAIGTEALGLVRFINPVTIGLTAVAGAVAFLALRASNVEKLSDVIEKQAKSVALLRQAYGLAGDAAEDYARRARPAIEEATGRELDTGIQRLAQGISDVESQFFSGRDNRIYRDQDRFQSVREALDDLRRSAQQGPADFIAFRNALAEISEANPDKAGWWQAFTTGDLARAMSEATDKLAKLQVEVDGGAMARFERDVRRANEALSSLQSRVAKFVPPRLTHYDEIQRIAADQARIFPTLNIGANVTGLPEKFADDTRRAIDELSRDTSRSLAEIQGQVADFDLSPVNRQIASTMRQYDAAIADLIETNGSAVAIEQKRQERIAALALITREATRAEELRRAGYALDIATVGRLTQAQQASADAERARIAALQEGRTAVEAAQRATEAYGLSVARSNAAIIESTRQRRQGMQDTLDSLAHEGQLIGGTVGETARLAAQFDLLRQARDAAYSEGRNIHASEIEAINGVATAVGHATSRIESMRIEQDLLFERSQLYRSDVEAQIAEATRGMEDADARVIGNLMRSNDRLREWRDEFRSLTDGLGSEIIGGAGLDDIGASIAKRLQDAAGQRLDKLVQEGTDALFASLFPNSASAALSMPDLGASPARPMYVSLVGGMGGAGGAIDRLLSPANENAIAAAPAARAESYRAAIAAIESRGSGDYSALGPLTRNGDRAYGRYQVMGNNIGPWSQQALGQTLSAEQFMANPQFQDRIFDHIFGGYVGKFGEGGAAQAWFGGPGSVGKGGRTDMLGTSVSGYAAKFEAELAKLPAAGTAIAGNATAFAGGMSAALNDTILGGIGAVADQFLPGFGGVLQNLLQGMQGAGGGGGAGGIIGALFGGPSPSAAVSQALASGAAGLFARGGIANRPSIFAEAGPEAAVPLPDGRSIPVTLRMPTAQATAAQSSPVQVVVNNNNGSKVTTREESDGRGGRRVFLQLDEAVSKSLRTGPQSKRAMGDVYGNRQRIVT